MGMISLFVKRLLVKPYFNMENLLIQKYFKIFTIRLKQVSMKNKVVIVVRSGTVSQIFSNVELEVTVYDEDNMRVGEDYIEEFNINPLKNQIEDYISSLKTVKV
jgi:hypothetical protein